MVKVNSVRQGKEIGVGRAFEFASESTPGLAHIVVCTKDQTVCSCTGFQTHGHCWHLRWVFENTSRRLVCDICGAQGVPRGPSPQRCVYCDEINHLDDGFREGWDESD